MATPIPFETLTGPLASGFADGATAFNLVASATERNLDLVNTWTTKLDKFLASKPAVLGSAVLTPASGWKFDVAAGRGTYARRWGPFSFVSTCLLRTGATIAAGSGGNVTDTPVATLAASWKPPYTQYVGASFHSYAPCSVYLSSSGAVTLTAMSQKGQIFPTNRVLIITAFWINLDVYFT